MNTATIPTTLIKNHAAENRAIYQAAKRRIEEAQLYPGAALKPGETAPPPSVPAKSTEALVHGTYNPLTGRNRTSAELAEEKAGGANAGIVNEVVSPAGESIVKWVKPVATKLALYGVLILGAVGMMIFGLSELLKPVGGPDLAGKAKGVARDAAIGLVAA